MFKRGIVQSHSNIFAMVMQVVDPLIILLATWLAHYLALDSWVLPDNYLLVSILAALLVGIIFSAFRVYESWRGETFGNELKTLLIACVTVFIALLLLSVVTKTSALFSRLWMGYCLICSAILLSLSRLLIRFTLRWLRARGLNQRRVVIIGKSRLAQDIASRILHAPWTGLNVLGFFDETPVKEGNQLIVGKPLLGGFDQIADYIEKESVDQVWLAMPWSHQEAINQVLHHLRHSTVDVRMVPDVFSYRLLNSSLSEVAGIPVLDLSRSPMYGVNRLLKAAEDFILALLILLLVSPLMIIIAIGVKLSSPGPILYRQERLGLNNKPFFMLKFRSMPTNAEEDSGPVWAKPNDGRTTWLGSLLRKTSLDELPQFINVLKGEMSIVGPRPERAVFVDIFKDQVPGYMKKHMVKAGITGWAQVNGWRGNTDLQRRIEYDLYYIENWSLWFDFKIIFLTIFKGLVNKNAY